MDQALGPIFWLIPARRHPTAPPAAAPHPAQRRPLL